MPIYQCISPEGLPDESQRENIAGEITRIHCDATGAPRSFVNVVFQGMPNGRSSPAPAGLLTRYCSATSAPAGMSRHGRRCFEICRKCGHGSLTSQGRSPSSRCGKSKPKTQSKPA